MFIIPEKVAGQDRYLFNLGYFISIYNWAEYSLFLFFWLGQLIMLNTVEYLLRIKTIVFLSCMFAVSHPDCFYWLSQLLTDSYWLGVLYDDWLSLAGSVIDWFLLAESVIDCHYCSDWKMKKELIESQFNSL